jgi:hypothetical protein
VSLRRQADPHNEVVKDRGSETHGVVGKSGSEATAGVFAAPKHAYTRALFEAALGRDFDFGRFMEA